MKDLVIYGAGGLGLEIETLVRELGQWNLLGFVDDGVPSRENARVLGDGQWLHTSQRKFAVVIAVGSPAQKRVIAHRLQEAHHLSFPSLIHPSATIGNPATVTLGRGCVVTAGARLTTHIQVGEHVLVNLNATIGHHCRLGAFSSIMPGVNLAGQVTIGHAVLVGSGANVLNGLAIGDNASIGSGAVVTRSVPPGETWVGVPARQRQGL